VGKVSEGRVEVGPWGSPEEQDWPFRDLWKHLALQTRPTIAFSVVTCILAVGQKAHNGNSG